MQVEDLQRLAEENPDHNEFAFEGHCHDCRNDTTVVISMEESGFKVTGGAVFTKQDKQVLKCQSCFDKEPALRQPCEVYSRVVGYMRPVNNWNKAKQNEFRTRKMMDRSVAAA